MHAFLSVLFYLVGLVQVLTLIPWNHNIQLQYSGSTLTLLRQYTYIAYMRRVQQPDSAQYVQCSVSWSVASRRSNLTWAGCKLTSGLYEVSILIIGLLMCVCSLIQANFPHVPVYVISCPRGVECSPMHLPPRIISVMLMVTITQVVHSHDLYTTELPTRIRVCSILVKLPVW